MFKKSLILFSILLFFVSIVNADQVGNGGSGIIRNENVLTFGSAGVLLEELKIERPTLGDGKLPGLSLAYLGLDNLALPTEDLKNLKLALEPTIKRRYFKALPSDWNAEKLEELKKIYKKTLNLSQNLEDITIFAITVGLETYLLPDFYNLKKETEQAAILLHEGVWVLRNRNLKNKRVQRQINYRLVSIIEISFQKYIESEEIKFHRVLIRSFAKALDNPYLSLLAAENFEKKQKLYRSLSLVQLFGEDYFESYNACVSNFWGGTTSVNYEMDLPSGSDSYSVSYYISAYERCLNGVNENDVFGDHLAILIKKQPGRPLLREIFYLREHFRIAMYQEKKSRYPYVLRFSNLVDLGSIEVNFNNLQQLGQFKVQTVDNGHVPSINPHRERVLWHLKDAPSLKTHVLIYLHRQVME